MISKGSAGNIAGYRLGKGTGDNKFYAWLGNGTANAGLASTSVASLGEWYHVAMVHDTDANTSYLYVNGFQEDSVSAFNLISDTKDLFYL